MRDDNIERRVDGSTTTIIDLLEDRLEKAYVDIEALRGAMAKLQIALSDSETANHVLKRKYAGRDPRSTSIGNGF